MNDVVRTFVESSGKENDAVIKGEILALQKLMLFTDDNNYMTSSHYDVSRQTTQGHCSTFISVLFIYTLNCDVYLV